MTSTRPDPCLWQSLSRSLVPLIVLSSTLFLIKELDALRVRGGVRRLSRLIFDRLVVRFKTCEVY